MKRMWLSKFKKEVEKQIKGTIIVNIETSIFLSDFEVEYIKIIIHNDILIQPLTHDIGTVDNLMRFNPVDVANTFIRYYKEIIVSKFFIINNIDKD